MSEQDKQGEAELNASQSPDSLADSTSTTDTAEITDSDLNGEESDGNLDLDKELSQEQGQGSVAEKQRQKQIATWGQRLADGEVTKDDIPKWVIKEMDFTDNEPDIDARIDAKVAEKLSLKEDAKMYNSLKDKLKKATVTKAQKEKLLTRLNGLSGKLPKGEALEVAIEAAGIQFSSSETKERPKSMNPPANPTKEHTSGIPKDANWKDVQKNYSEEDRKKALLKELDR